MRIGLFGYRAQIKYSVNQFLASIDISDFLTEEIKGPDDFKCKGDNCSFEEPAMNELILSVFGGSSITIDCIQARDDRIFASSQLIFCNNNPLYLLRKNEK